MRNVVFIVLALALLPGWAAAEQVATVGKKTIDRADVDKAVKSQLVALERERYEIIKGGVEQLVAESLFEQEATARGVTVEQLQQVEIVDKVQQPTDAQIQKVFDENKEQLGEATLDQVKPQIVEYLVRQGAQQRRDALIVELKKKYPTTVWLKAPTVQVAFGSTPPKGNPKAPVTIIEFSDYECPFCKRVEPTVEQVLKTYGPDKVRFAYRNFPLPMHTNARPAAEAAGCANEQGKFWEYHEKLMAASDLSPDNFKKLAGEVGMDAKKFDDCLAAQKFKDAIDKDVEAGEAAGVNGTPAFFINGRMLDGAQPFESFKEVIDEELASAAKKS
jgi:predicted DsbA family dithiol-disulfide isomerase